MQHLIAMVMCKTWCNTGVERCWHILPTVQILPQVIAVYLRTLKNIEGKQSESEDNINTAVNAPVHRSSKDEYKTVTDCLPHRWEKSMDSAGDYME